MFYAGETYMKKLFVVCISVLTLSCPCAIGFSDILSDLQNFQKSLGDWVTQTRELSQRLSELEGEHKARDKQIAGYNQSIADIEKLIAGLNDKVDKVEKMGSLKGVKDIVKTFEGTLDVFKNRFSEMAKKLEDQEVKTSVLERIYQTAQKPIETLIASMDEQKDIINKLAERLDGQEKLILAMEKSLKKQISPYESLAKGVEEMNARLGKLESGVVVQKRELKEEAPKKVPKKAEKPPGKEMVKKDDTAAVQPEEAKKPPAKKTDEVSGFIAIGEGFLLNNVKLNPFGSSSQMSGEIMNKSERDYSTIDFRIQAYNEENIILGGHGFSIRGFKKDSTKKFEEIITGAETEEIARYSIYPAGMPLVSDTGESTIRMIEKELPGAKTVTKKAEVKTPKNLEELLFAEGKKEIPKELEGFENAGNEFYAGKVSFKGFGSSSTVTGEIKNYSKKDFYNVLFIMKIYSRDYGMITSLEFPVRRIKGGETKPFEEIIAGVNPIDIARYEIEFKSAY